MKSSRGNYTNHKSSILDSHHINETDSDDQKSIKKRLQQHIQILTENGFQKIPPLHEVIKRNKMGKKDYIDFIEQLMNRLAQLLQYDNSKEPTHRGFCKANYSQNDITLAYCSYLYPVITLDFFQYYINQNPKVKNKKKCYEEMKLEITKIHEKSYVSNSPVLQNDLNANIQNTQNDLIDNNDDCSNCYNYYNFFDEDDNHHLNYDDLDHENDHDNDPDWPDNSS